LLVFTPLAYGTVEPWSEAIAELVVLGMAVTWVLARLPDWELRLDLPPGWLPAALFLVLVVVQVIWLPAALIRTISPLTAAMDDAAVAYSAESPALWSVSLAPHATWQEGLKLLAVAAFFLVLYNTYRTRGQLQRAVWAMIAIGTLISVFGIVQRMTWNGRFYWIGPEAPHGAAFGPFVNRAHFAGLIVVVVPLALALILAERREPTRRPLHDRGWRGRLRRWNSQQARPTRLVPFLMVLMGAAALVSGSRGGVVSLVVALLAMVGLGASGRSGMRRAARVAVATALILLAGIWIGGDILYGTIERLAEEVGRPEESARVAIWTDAIDLWRRAPALGTGLASFEVAYPSIRTIKWPVTFLHAESDWVQLLTDTGLVGLGLAVATVVILALALLRRARWAEAPRTRMFALAGLIALFGATVQGIGNFNLPVMSNLLYLAVAVVAGLQTDG
jgi:O-antigen ligase